MDFIKSLWTNKSVRNGIIISLIAIGVILALILTY